MSYGHAQAILMADGRKDPSVELRAAVRCLKLWADLNPGLQSLYLDFEACLRDVETFVKTKHCERCGGDHATDDSYYHH